MYKLTFTLKQHTPIIHFQHDQEGATLRASEVKPKLDRFLIKEFGGIEMLRDTHPDWFISRLNNALNYQMAISVPDSFTYPIELPKIGNDNRIDLNAKPIDFPCFFGNMGKNDSAKDKRFTFTQGEINILLNSNSFSLIKFLTNQNGEEIRGLFFNKINFATRQSKGFGSFSTVDEYGDIDFVESRYSFDVPVDINDLTTLLNQLRLQHRIRYPQVDITDDQLLLLNKWRFLFHNINLFHKVLKSGYNQQHGYVKSALFKYFKEVWQVQWDKKSIKERYFTNNLDQQIERPYEDKEVLEFDESDPKNKKCSLKGNPYLVRDLLGLTSEAEWKEEYSNAVISKNNPEIDRFKSPITYKPILFNDDQGEFFRVFLFFDKIPDEFLEKSFDVKVNKAGTLVLDTPDRSMFSLTTYFKFLASEDFQIEDLINKKNKDTSRIKTMFDALKIQEEE